MWYYKAQEEHNIQHVPGQYYVITFTHHLVIQQSVFIIKCHDVQCIVRCSRELFSVPFQTNQNSVT